MIKILVLFLILISGVLSCTSQNKEKSKQVKTPISLKQRYKNNFYIGASINKKQILEKDTSAVSIIRREFNTITPENHMKWMYLEPKPNKFSFEIADKYVEFGEKYNMHIVGHTLVWHYQLAKFMNQIKDSTEMANHIKNHIKTVVTRYKGRVGTWDVVNEALNDDGSFRKSNFFNVMGRSYIELAFKLAEKYDSQSELVYNDYSLWKEKKREATIQLVKKLKEHGAKVDVVGMQAHWGLTTPSLEDVEKSIIAFSELGVKVSITELDITVLPNPWELDGADASLNYTEYIGDKRMNPYQKKLADSVQIKLATRYKNIFKLFLKHKDKINRVTFWCVTDGDSWLNNSPIKKRTNYPLLFDRQYQPKKAYQSIINLKNISK